jgi:hypothetical protein
MIITAKRNPVTIISIPPPPTHPLQPLATTNLHSVSMDLPIIDMSWKWDHTPYNLLCLAFSLSKMFLSEV